MSVTGSATSLTSQIIDDLKSCFHTRYAVCPKTTVSVRRNHCRAIVGSIERKVARVRDPAIAKCMMGIRRYPATTSVFLRVSSPNSSSSLAHQPHERERNPVGVSKAQIGEALSDLISPSYGLGAMRLKHVGQPIDGSQAEGYENASRKPP